MRYSILTICTRNYRDAYSFSIASWLATRAKNVFIYTDDPTWKSSNRRVQIIPFFPKSADWLINVGRKPTAALDLLDAQPLAENVVFLDIDCYIRHEFGRLFKQDFDFLATQIESHRTKCVSSGVWLFRNSEKARAVLQEWQRVQARNLAQSKGVRPHYTSYSQWAFDEVCRKYERTGEIKVTIVSDQVYNRGITTRDPDWWDSNGIKQPLLGDLERDEVTVLHFQGNEYRSPALVKQVFALWKKQ